MAPLLSRQAVQVLGIDQDFSNRKAREMLGWEPRVDYATGLEATVGCRTLEGLSVTRPAVPTAAIRPACGAPLRDRRCP